jgi:hypothetical protein
MHLVDALDRPELLGDSFAHPSWSACKTVLRVLDGLPLADEAHALYVRCTGRSSPPERPAREAFLVVGRRGGKSRIAAALAVEAACLRKWDRYLSPGETATVAVIAADRPQARVIMGYVRGLLAAPMLARRVRRETADAVELRGRVRVEITTASARTTRGYSFACVICDELAFWKTDEAGSEPDTEILAAIRPGMATLPGSRLICISSPYARRGALWKAYREHHGVEDDPTLVWQADSQTMNPSLDPTVVAAAYEQDAAAAGAEYGAVFRSDLESFGGVELLDAVTSPGVVERPPVPRARYCAFLDAASGTGRDAFAVGIAHPEPRPDGEACAVLDLTREIRPPFDPLAVAGELAQLLRRYRVEVAHADRYSGGFVVEAFRRYGLHVEQDADPKSQVYLAALPLLAARRVDLLDVPRLRGQLAALERRRRSGGRDVVDHPPGGHDDLANAACGALVLAHAAAVGDAPILAANVNPLRNTRVLDRDGPNELEWMRRI